MTNKEYKTEIEILEIYAKCWNTLNSNKLNSFIDEKVEYNSQWVIESLNGKQAFLDYFNGKLNTLRKAKLETQVSAAFHYVPSGETDRPADLLSHQQLVELLSGSN
jgi:hypothetical protein